MDFVRFFLKHASSYVLLEHWKTTALRAFFKTVNVELNSEPQIPWGISRACPCQQLCLVGKQMLWKMWRTQAVHMKSGNYKTYAGNVIPQPHKALPDTAQSCRILRA